jgi:hypothetical protein
MPAKNRPTPWHVHL